MGHNVDEVVSIARSIQDGGIEAGIYIPNERYYGLSHGMFWYKTKDYIGEWSQLTSNYLSDRIRMTYDFA